MPDFDEAPAIDERVVAVTDAAPLTLRVLTAGSGVDTLVFLHGVGARADRWRSTMTRCAAAGFRAVAVDFPGHGYSTKGPNLEYSVPGFAAATSKVLATLGMERVTLVGTSLGAHVASVIALRQPRLVERLVLVGPTGIVPLGAGGRESLAAAVQDVSRGGVERKLRRLVHDDRALVTEEWIAEETAVNSSPGAEAAMAALAAYFRTRIDEDAVGDALLESRPDLPCLLVWGACDDLVPTDLAPEVLRRLPASARLVTVPETAHAPHLEQPDQFADALLSFLDSGRQ